MVSANPNAHRNHISNSHAVYSLHILYLINLVPVH